MQFKDIIGQEQIIERLLQSVKTGRISHAQLFAGKEGAGKLALALAYAQYISCTNKNENDSCGECSSCKKFKKLAHPDLHFVFPVVTQKKIPKPISDDYLQQWREIIQENYSFSFNNWVSKIGSENKQAAIYVHESKEIIKKLNFKTYESEYKIMIIWHPDKMNTVTANKLLKMIEEPPSKTLFLLLTNAPDQILGTIFSRTQLIKIPQIEKEALKNHFQIKYELSEADANSVSHVANGNYLAALEQFEATEQNQNNFRAFSELMRLVFVAPKDNSKIAELVKWAEDISRWGRERQKDFLSYALRMFRENFVINIAEEKAENIVFLASEELSFSEKFSPFIHSGNITQIYKQFNKAYADIVRNGAAKIVFLDLALQLVKLLRKKNPMKIES
ncbi:MAG: DNA polymerase III subunit delta' [Bacteroidales bacterium]|nr:DNA polymerase III subunit delta' [Bacteroidales bacterium]